MRVAVLQSNYVPWKGYFDLIHDVECFVFYDEVQYTKNDWRNRNRIYTKNGLQWLTIPVSKDSVHYKVSEVPLPTSGWRELHWKSLVFGYHRAPFFSQVEELMRPMLVEGRYVRLSEMNQALIREICSRLGVRTKIIDSAGFVLESGKVDRLLSLLRQVQATNYLSGPAGRTYLAPQEARFAAAGVRIEYMDYSGYPSYPQLREPFEPAVSILDLVANVEWSRIPEYIWGHRAGQDSGTNRTSELDKALSRKQFSRSAP